ncbi:uncharacterized protein LOC121386800 [Gigantopelta aegis]|uniref:uncharacterized protein LOC121386800 n=1 Tax=Gigantopelta aegis TaxID=1735272 RepID=UPI001B88A410|nr:uncharacterized protein LOC121386800 [Gigantopelta aegis]
MYWISVILFLMCSKHVQGEATTSVDCLDYGKPGQNINLTCRVISGTLRSGFTWWRPNGGTSTVVMECNTNNDACDPVRGITGYIGVPDTANAACNLIIESFNPSVDVGEWTCQDGPTGTGKSTCNKMSILSISSINITNALPTQEQISSEKDFNISTIIDCAFPSVNVSWVFGDSQTLTPVITTDDTECDSPLVKTIAVLTMNGKSMTGHVHVSVRLIHPSFENENEVLDILIGVADFPAVPDEPERMSALSAGAISGIVIAVVLALAIPTVWTLYKRKIKKKAEDEQNEPNN